MPKIKKIEEIGKSERVELPPAQKYKYAVVVLEAQVAPDKLSDALNDMGGQGYEFTHRLDKTKFVFRKVVN